MLKRCSFFWCFNITNLVGRWIWESSTEYIITRGHCKSIVFFVPFAGTAKGQKCTMSGVEEYFLRVLQLPHSIPYLFFSTGTQSRLKPRTWVYCIAYPLMTYVDFYRLKPQSPCCPIIPGDVNWLRSYLVVTSSLLSGLFHRFFCGFAPCKY